MGMDRKTFIRNMAVGGSVVWISKPVALFMEKGSLEPDHFMLGCSDLKQGIRFVKEKTGVEAVVGGKHPDVGTHNALLSLGNKTYLEIIAPDPDAVQLSEDYKFLKEFKSPTLFYWAVHTEDMEAVLKKVKGLGIKNSGINDGSRIKPDGTVLKWRTLSIGGDSPYLMPFFIQWNSQSRHPSIDAPKGCSVKSYFLVTPDVSILKKKYEELGIRMPLQQGKTEVLHLSLQTPKGLVQL